MKVLHLFPKSNLEVSLSTIKFINMYFRSDLHSFLIINPEKDISKEIIELSNVKLIEYYQFNEFIDDYDKVILHSITNLPLKLKLSYLFSFRIMKKIVWVSWGSDLYQNKFTNKNLIFVIKKLIDVAFIRRVKNFVGIFPPDIDYFKRKFRSNAKTYYASYVDINNALYYDHNFLKKILKNEETNKFINVTIGHSSAIELNHIKVLRDLFKFKNENLKIYIPLSYGDVEYGNLVENEAKRLFGADSICIREYMNKESYMKHLAKMDIAIFNTERQIGLWNIYPLIYMRKIIYMPSDSTMYKYFNSKGVTIFDYNHIVNSTRLGDLLIRKNNITGKEYIEENELDIEEKIKMWKSVFDFPIE